MIWFIAGIIAMIATIVLIFMKERIAVAAFAIAVALFVVSVIGIVPTGYTGILTTFGKVSDRTLESGLNIVAPWQSVTTMDNREQKIKFELDAFSSDIQLVTITGSVNYSIDKTTAMELYRSVGLEYADIVISPQISEDTKTVIGHYTAEGLIENRVLLPDEMLTSLRKDLSGYGLNITTVAIENIDFSDAFEQAVEAKQVATQTKLRAQTEQEQQTMEAEQAAERLVIAAQADSDVAKIQADAEAYAITTKATAQAEANSAIAKSITPDFIKYTQIVNWNGILPNTVVGADSTALPIVGVNQ